MGGVAVSTAVWILGNALPWYLKIQGWLECPRLLALKDGLSNGHTRELELMFPVSSAGSVMTLSG